MIKFEDRQGANLNRKIFEVEKVERDEAGEIIRIIGTLVRADEPEIEGTPLNAENLSLLVDKYYPIRTTATISASVSGMKNDTLKIEIAEPLSVSITNNYSQYFTVTNSSKSNDEEILLVIEAKQDTVGTETTEHNFTVTLTSKETGVKRGTITYTVYITKNPSEGND